MPKTRAFDAAEYLDSPEMIAAYLTEALETDDEAFIAKAIGTIARAQGMSAVADSAGLSRENLYRALSGNSRPEFETIRKVLGALGEAARGVRAVDSIRRSGQDACGIVSKREI